MFYRRGYGFRGGSPPWPYVGRGRGGLPRCWYPWADYWQMPPTEPCYDPYYSGPMGPAAYYTWPPPGAAYPPDISREEEIQFLKEQAQDIKEELDAIQARIGELESE
ncbi:MAG: DUF5320 domain-containing protein [Dehalococcoidia bacterium]